MCVQSAHECRAHRGQMCWIPLELELLGHKSLDVGAGIHMWVLCRKQYMLLPLHHLPSPTLFL